jgi:tetratricopeptide (TPR) repeat protein
MSSNQIIEQIVVEVSTDPLNPVLNFNAAVEYKNLNQTASAVGFYLRAAEYGIESHPLIVYSSLLNISICMESQKDRAWTVSNTILQAISYLPMRPEAYFMLSKFYEKSGQWQEAYTFAKLGLLYADYEMIALPEFTDYIGKEGLEFQLAVSAWWIGRNEESFGLHKKLSKSKTLPKLYKDTVLSNLSKMAK